MDRESYERYVMENYEAQRDNPWDDKPAYTVFRHPSNKKWFALIMRIPRDKLEPGDGEIDVVNLKCRPEWIGSLVKSPGIYPAYHMNRAHWLTVLLDGTVPAETLEILTEESFGLTMRMPKKRG